MGVRFTLLGPVEVRGQDGYVPRWEPRHRALLAYLLLHAGTVVSTDRLIGAIWGVTPPDTARSQIHTLVATVRRALRQAGAEQALQSRTAGYVIYVQAGQLDLEEFTERAASDEAEQVRGALALWAGEPLAGIRADYVPEARQRLEERRMRAVERLADLELDLGRHTEIVDELATQVAAHPLRERLVGQLMLALHRAGRQAEALTTARTFRTALVEQQGLDPSRTFAALEQSILRDDPHLTQPAQQQPKQAAEPHQPQRVSHLPYDIADFTGRADEVDTLIRSWSADSGVVGISAIDGMAGIGKTTLAIHAAHLLADRFPDGRLFVDLHAHTPGQSPVEPAAALETLLRQLGLPAEQIPAEVTDRAALWRTELTGRQALIVLDNVAGTDQVRPLLPGATASLMLITSRRRLTDLDGAQALSMDLPAAQEATELFTTIVGDRALAEPVAVLDVLQLCGFLPLAFRIAAARLRHRPRWTVRYLADRLRDERRRLTELATPERGVAAAFALSYQQLDLGQQRLFRLLGLHPGADLDAHSAAALADLPLDEAEAILEDLLDAHMLLQHQPGRYTLHDLLRQYAHAAAEADEPAESRREALTRLFDHYLYTASKAIDLVFPNRKHHRPRIPQPGTPVVRFGGTTQATEWLDTERANLIDIGACTADDDQPGYVSRLAVTLYQYLYDHAHYDDALLLHGKALDAGRRGGDKACQARALIDLGIVYFRRGRYEQAHEHSRQALDLYLELGDRLGEGRALNNLGNVCWRQGSHDQALDRYRQALELCRDLGERANEAVALSNLGLAYEGLHRYEQARDHYQQALDLHRELGDRGGEAVALGNLGSVHERLGRYEQSREQLLRALDLCRELGYRTNEAESLNSLGETARSMGDLVQAVDDHDAALAVALEVGVHHEQARAHAGLARAHHDLGEHGESRAHAQQALDLYTDLGVPEADEIHAFLDTLGQRP
ncbi:tetratricopeptide repeat protein [Nonomuraea sp. 10N515B]|uniref:tetratricopeptide repeat protein n=1 Tax=Nonomuraea sp. 10N515B TaxID=3457422 RepID=UPI003FCC7F32